MTPRRSFFLRPAATKSVNRPKNAKLPSAIQESKPTGAARLANSAGARPAQEVEHAAKRSGANAKADWLPATARGLKSCRTSKKTKTMQNWSK